MNMPIYICHYAVEKLRTCTTLNMSVEGKPCPIDRDPTLRASQGADCRKVGVVS